MDIIGLGEAGCNIAECFRKYPQYKNIYKIDSVEHKESGKFFKIKERATFEDYEEKCPSMKRFFAKLSKEVIFVVGGSGRCSLMSLAVLEQIKDREIIILFVKPDSDLLSEDRKKIGKIVFNVLQEYTRSGLFDRMLIVDNIRVQKTLDSISIMNYFEKMNELIASTVHMINVYKNIKPVYENKLEKSVSCRVGTIGLYELESSENKVMFDLDFPRYKRYFYCINEEKLNNDGDLLNIISSQMKEQASSDETNVSFGIYATNYENDYVYSIWYSNKIQDWS